MIGFIGLGIMGKPMAKNLIKAGYDLLVYDIVPEAVETLRAAGAQAAGSIANIAQQCEIIITMLPNSPQVRDVCLNENGLLPHIKPGSVVIDMSSINPNVSREVAAALETAGCDMLDAPVSGGEPKAIDGTLSIMAGGKRDSFETHKELLLKMGASAVWCGEVGAGNVVKLCNQVVVAANIAAVAEALVLGKKSGVDPQIVFDAIRGGLAGSTVMDAKAPMMIAKNFKPGFKIDLHIKDLKNVVDTARDTGAPMYMTSQTFEMMKTLVAHGDGALDHSALLKYYELLTGEEL